MTLPSYSLQDMLDSVMASPASPPVTISRKGRRARVLLSDSDSSPLGSPPVAPKPSLLQPPSFSLGDCSPQLDQAAAAMLTCGTHGLSNRCPTASPPSSAPGVRHPTAVNAVVPCGRGFQQAVTHASSSMSLHGYVQMEHMEQDEAEVEDAPLAFQRSVRRAGARCPSFLLHIVDEAVNESGSPPTKSSPRSPTAYSTPSDAAAALPSLRLTAAACNDGDGEGSDAFFTPDGALTPDEASGEDACLPGFDVRPGHIRDGASSPNFLGMALEFSSDALTGGRSAASVTAGAPCSNFSSSVIAGAPSGGCSTAHPSGTPAVCGGNGRGGRTPVDRLILLSSNGVASTFIGGNVRGSSSNSRRIVSGFAVGSASGSSRGGSGGPLVFTRSVFRCAGRRRLLEDDEDDEEGGGSDDGAGGAGGSRPGGGPAVALDFGEGSWVTPSTAGRLGGSAGSPGVRVDRPGGTAGTGGSEWRRRVGGSSPHCSPSPGLNARPASAAATAVASDSMAAAAANPAAPATANAAAAANLAAVAIRPISTATGVCERKAGTAGLDVRKALPFASDVIVISSDDEGDESAARASSSSGEGDESGENSERNSGGREGAASGSLLLGNRLPDAEKVTPTPPPPPPSRPRQIRGALELASLMNRQLSLAEAQPVAQGRTIPAPGEEDEEGVIDLASSSCGSDTDGSDDGRSAGPVRSIDLTLRSDPRPTRGILSLLGAPGSPQVQTTVAGGATTGVGGRGTPIPTLAPHLHVIKGGGRHISAAPKPAAAPRIPSIASPDAK